MRLSVDVGGTFTDLVVDDGDGRLELHKTSTTSPDPIDGILAVLEIAAQGFERPLLTLVREWEVPERGAEVSIAVDPESVLVFPAEGRRGDDRKLMPEAPEIPEIQAFKTH